MNRYFGVHVLDGEWHALLPRYALLANRVDGKRVLDVGCGTGIGSSLLMELGAEQVDGVDYRPKVLELANMKHAKESLNFHRMLLEELSFDANSFDLALCLDPSHPVTDNNLLEEVERVLTDDGEYICAIERRTVEGLESLLPQYGYEDAGESIEIPRRENQAPQIGQLRNHFESVGRVQQRPSIGFQFEESSEHEEAAGLDAHSSVIDVDARFQDAGDESAGVEILFCGPDTAPPPDTAEIQLPYYRLADRLKQLFRDLHRGQTPGGDDHEFDEIVEKPESRPDQDVAFDERTSREFEQRETQRIRDPVDERQETTDVTERPASEAATLPESLQQQLQAHAERLESLEDKIESLTEAIRDQRSTPDTDGE